MRYTTAATMVQENREKKKRKFDELLKRAKGDKYYYDPKTKTSKLKARI